MRKDSHKRMWSCKGSQREGSYWVWSREEGEYHTEANVGNFRYYIIQLSLRNVSFILKGPMESLKSLNKRVTFYLHLANRKTMLEEAKWGAERCQRSG